MGKKLSQILAEMKALEDVAAVDIDSVPTRTRAGVAIAKEDAAVKLKALRVDYGSRVGAHVGTIFLQGPLELQQKFALVAAAEGGTLTVDAQAIYRKIAIDVEPTIGAGRQFGGTQLNHLIRSLEEVARVAGAEFLPVPHLDDVRYCGDVDAVVVVVRELIRRHCGDDLNRRAMEEEILSLALGANYDRAVVPVVVVGATPEELPLQAKIFTGVGTVVVLSPDQDIDVVDAFKKLQVAMKSNK